MGSYNSTWYCFGCHKPLLEDEIYDKLKDDEEPYCPLCKSELVREVDEDIYKKLKELKRAGGEYGQDKTMVQ